MGIQDDVRPTAKPGTGWRGIEEKQMGITAAVRSAEA